MPKLHELLAVEKTKSAAANKLLTETQAKFGKFEYFQGHTKSLKMIEDSPQNAAIEAAAAETRQLPTTVYDTLAYTLKYWADAEDIILQKNITNQSAKADIEFRGTVIAKDVPVDELLGLETRLESLRKVLDHMPTLNAGTNWVPSLLSDSQHSWMLANPEKTIKTEKTTTPVVLYEATKEHPAQIKEVTVDKTVGTFQLLKYCGAATSQQKANVISVLDDLTSEVKKARMRANCAEVQSNKIGGTIVNLILEQLK